MSRPLRTLVPLLLCLSLLLTACGGSQSSAGGSQSNTGGSQSNAGAGPSAGGTIRFGFINPLSGDSATYGVAAKNGMDMAVEEINKAGGIKGRKIELVTYDDAGDPNQAVTGAQKFANDQSIVAVSGSALSTSTLAMIPILDRARLPDVTFSSSTPKLHGISKYFFRMGVQDAQVGPLMGELAVSALHARKVSILYPNNDYGKGLATATEAKVKALGAEVADNLSYLATDKDFSALLTRVQNSDPDVLALCGTYTDSGLIVKQAHEMGIKAKIIGGTGFNSPEFPKIAGSAADGVIFLSVFVPTSTDPQVQKFVSDYKARYNMLPDTFAALGYDVLHVLARAAEKALDAGSLTRESMQQALTQIDYKGITGEVKFTDQNEWERPYLYTTVHSGVFVPYQQ